MNIIEKIKSDFVLSLIAQTFDNEVYLVGGSVRDYFLGKSSLHCFWDFCKCFWCNSVTFVLSLLIIVSNWSYYATKSK